MEEGTDVHLLHAKGLLLHAKFHPHRCNDKGVGSQELKFVLRFDQNVENKRPAGAYPLRVSQNLHVSTPFEDTLAVNIWLDLLDGLCSFGRFNLRGLVTPTLSAPLAVKLRQIPKRFRGARTCSRSFVTMPSLAGLGFHPRRGGQKR